MSGIKLTKRPLWTFGSGRAFLACVLLCLLTVVNNGYAQTDNAAQLAGVSVSIRFYNKAIYFPGSDVEIKVTIANDSGSTYRFKLADNRLYSIDFDVRTMTNTEVLRSQKFTTQMNSNQPAFFRDVSIDPGEAYSFTETLADFRDITDPGMYVVTARFFPSLNPDMGATGKQPASLTSNRLTLSVRPSAQGLAAVQEKIDQQTGEVLSREALPPDQVVAFTIQARQHGNWNRFFLYLDVPSLIKRDPARARRFLRMSETDQQAFIQKFKADLQHQTDSSDIVVVPSSFQIIKTSYTPDRGTVEALEKFKNSNFTEVKRYTYTLERRDNIWYIVGYEVQNLGTE